MSTYNLYSISHPNKHGLPMHDLSSDEEATPDTSETLTNHQLLIERIITRVFSEYNICCVIDDEMRALFKSKLWRVGQEISKAGSKLMLGKNPCRMEVRGTINMRY